MAEYLQDISRFGRSDAANAVGAFPSPALTGMGASNPISSYFQAAAAPSFEGVNSGAAWDGMRMRTPNIAPPGVNDTGNGWSTGLGMNIGTAQLALGGLQTLGSLWQAWEANKLAKEQFKFQKEFANTNLANQIQSYNTTLEDRTRSRTHTEGGTQEAAQEYIDRHSLRRRA